MNRFKFLRIALFVSALVFTISCGDSKPSGVLAEKEMGAVIWDLALAGEYVNGYVYYQKQDQNRAAINNELLKEIYQAHGITKKEFDKSLEYYKQHPKLLMAILDSLTVKHGGQPTAPITDPALTPPPAGIQTPPISPVPAASPAVDSNSKPRAEQFDSL